MSLENLDPGSFRDPAGQVFTHAGSIYRSIFKPGVEDYEASKDKGAHDKLIEGGILLPHSEIPVEDFFPPGTVYGLSHPVLPMVTYPWEWPFSMLKDAAILHLDAMELLLPEGLWLRDANAFNVQYDGQKLRLIDTLSIGQRVAESPWVAYNQFCSQFLAPLAVAAYCDIRTLSLWRNYIDGFPLDLVSKLIPRRRRFSPRLFFHLTLHARVQDSADWKEELGKETVSRKPKVSDRALTGLIHSLRRAVEGIQWKPSSKIWDEYETIRTYEQEDVARKSEFLEKMITEHRPGSVWDLGGNTGEFSLIAASQGAYVVSIDGDPACTEYLYNQVPRGNGGPSIMPLTMNLANPSPGLGWANSERPGLKDRGPADLVLALALIHHLVFSCNIPLYRIAEWFSGLAKTLLVEFVPASDPMVQKLLVNRGDEHLPYDQNVFLSAFGEHFSLAHNLKLKNGRELYYYQRK